MFKFGINFNKKKGIQIWRRKEKVDSSLKKRGKEIWRRKGVVESSEQGTQRNLNTEKSMEPHNLSKGGTINVQPQVMDGYIGVRLQKPAD